MFAKIYNIIQLIGWSLILGLTLCETISGTHQTSTIQCLVKIMQLTQIWDLVSNLIGLTSGSLISNILQLGGRLFVALIFIYEGVDFSSLANAVIAWSMAEVIRFLFYLSKENQLFITLRYNAFMILYPVGITGELRLVQRYLETHEDVSLQLRALQLTLILGGVFMFKQMLTAKLKRNKQQNKQTTGNANSPTRTKRE